MVNKNRETAFTGKLFFCEQPVLKYKLQKGSASLVI